MNRSSGGGRTRRRDPVTQPELAAARALGVHPNGPATSALVREALLDPRNVLKHRGRIAGNSTAALTTSVTNAARAGVNASHLDIDRAINACALRDRRQRPAFRKELIQLVSRSNAIALAPNLLVEETRKNAADRAQSIVMHLERVRELLADAGAQEFAIRVKHGGLGRDEVLALLDAEMSASRMDLDQYGFAVGRGSKRDPLLYGAARAAAQLFDKYVGPFHIVPDGDRAQAPFVKFLAAAFSGTQVDFGTSPTGIFEILVTERPMQ